MRAGWRRGRGGLSSGLVLALRGVAHAGDAAFPIGGTAPRDGGVFGRSCLATAENGGEGEGEESQDDFFHDMNDCVKITGDASRSCGGTQDVVFF